jgi:hypothetical protein
MKTIKILLSAVAIVPLLLIAETSFGQAAPAWTSAATAGSIMETASLNRVAVTQESTAGITFGANRAGTIKVRYNVVNTAVLPGGQSTGLPPWTTFEMADVIPAGGAAVTASLYKLAKCGDIPVLICQINGAVNPLVKCDTCAFAAGAFDYFNFIYYVEVTLTRPSNAVAAPKLYSLRVYN